MRENRPRPGSAKVVHPRDAIVRLESSRHIIWTALGGTGAAKLCSTRTADGMPTAAATLNAAVDVRPAEQRIASWLMEC